MKSACESIVAASLICMSLACTSVRSDAAIDPQAPGAAATDRIASSTRLAQFEPADGRILHLTGGTAGQDDAVLNYTTMTGPERAPMGTSMWLSLPGTRPFNMALRTLNGVLDRAKRDGRMLNLTLDFRDGKVDGYETARDREFAETTNLDADANAAAAMIARSGVAVMLRIGGELNGDWEGLHPYVFPLAFRKLVQIFRAADARNVAFVWTVETQGDAAIDESDGRGRARWYPGDEWVDWLGLDVFPVVQFDRQAAKRNTRARKIEGVTDVADTLLRMARRTGKPVFIGETSPYQVNIPDAAHDPDGKRGQAAWNAWFVPFLRWLDANPEIKAVTMLSVDWSKTGPWQAWGDSRIHINPRVTELWRAELDRPRWMHLPEWQKVNGWSEAPRRAAPASKRGE